MEYQEDIIRYKKKSQAKTPKKSKHKHVYEPCVLEYPDDWYKKEHERNGNKRYAISSYCPVCGKVGGLEDIERWYQSIVYPKPFFHSSEPTDECKRELDPETRTLPTFCVEDTFQKFVELKQEG